MVAQDIYFPESLRMAIANRDVAGTGTEMLRMNVGFRALPVDPATKAPFTWVTPRGVRDSTTDPMTLRQWFAVAQPAGLAIVPGPGFVVIDDDTGDLDIGTLGLAGTFAETTRRGTHSWAMVPAERRLRKTKLPGGDLITGEGSYVVMSPTPPYWPVDLEAPILALPADSPLWELAAPREAPGTVWPSTITVQDRADASATLRHLQKGKFAMGIDALFSDEWRQMHSDWSQSERDASLVFNATHFVRSHPRASEVLFSLLWSTGWPQDPTRDHPKRNPEQYAAITVANALAKRQRRNEERRDNLAQKFTDDSYPRRVIGANSLLAPGSIDSGILAFAARETVDEFSRPDGWRRLPVDDVAAIYGVSRECIRKHLVALTERGCIERRSEKHPHEGGRRTDSLVRLLSPVEE